MMLSMAELFLLLKVTPLSISANSPIIRVRTARSRLVFIVGGEARLSWTNFTYNYEVVLVVFGFTSFKDCMFENNRVPESTNSIGLVTIDYGAILLADRSTVVIRRCLFLENEATATGGIIVLDKVVMNTDSIVLANNKANEGSIVMIDSTATFNTTTEIRNNFGCLISLTSRVEFSGFTTFFNNTSSTREFDDVRGGALTLHFGELHFTGTSSTVEFVSNYAMSGELCTLLRR